MSRQQRIARKRINRRRLCRCAGWWFPHRRGSMPAEGSKFEGRTHRRDLLIVMRDVAALLPSAARLHPDDLFKLQTRVVGAIEAAS